MELLYETISSKRSRNVNQSYLEPIILKFVELSVSLRKSKIVKDGLYQYKKNIQTTSIGSIEIVVRRFIELSEEKVTSAQAQADRITIDADEDLEAGDSPEDILLSTVSSEQSKDRTDREVVTPWLKFLWEAYRSTLDLLRNNSKLEVLYQTVVNQAFGFCVKYTRKTEFRRLCELLRNHLHSASGQGKNTGQLNPIDLSDADTLQRYLDTRFEQLNVAVKLELWQEAFRSVEDVHTLLTVSKRPPKGPAMANYFENLGRIFLVGGNQLFHAAAWSKYYNLVLQARSIPESELTRIASLLLLSALSIPAFSQQSRTGLAEIDDQKHRNTRLSGLLNLTKTPTRESLINSAMSKNVLSYVRPEIRDLYKILEVDFHPLALKSKLGPVLSKIGNDVQYQPYVKSLYQVILARLFQQLSQVYKTVKLDFVIQLASFPAPFDATPVEIEKFVVKGCQRGEFGVRIDHECASITFKDDVYDDSTRFSISNSKSNLQDTPSDIVRTQLSRLAKTMFKVVNEVDLVYIGEREAARQSAIDRAVHGLQQENLAILRRQEAIETRQRDAELEQLKREEEEAKKKAQRIQQEQLAEQQRLAEDSKRRELERIKKEQEAIKESEKRKIAEEINAKGIIKIDINKLDDLDTNKLRIMQVEQLAKEKNDLNERLRIIGRRIDHSERAKRVEEAELWKQDAEVQQQRDVKLYEARNQAIRLKSRQQFEEQHALKTRLERIVGNYVEFRKGVESKRSEMFEAKRKENAKLLEEEKQQRIKIVRQRREQERKQREAAEREREEREEREAEELAIREEEERNKPTAYRVGALRGQTNRSVSQPAPVPPPPSSGGGEGGGVYRPGAFRSQAAPASRAVSTSGATNGSANGSVLPTSAPAPAPAHAPAPAPAPTPGKYVPGAFSRNRKQ